MSTDTMVPFQEVLGSQVRKFGFPHQDMSIPCQERVGGGGNPEWNFFYNIAFPVFIN